MNFACGAIASLEGLRTLFWLRVVADCADCPDGEDASIGKSRGSELKARAIAGSRRAVLRERFRRFDRRGVAADLGRGGGCVAPAQADRPALGARSER